VPPGVVDWDGDWYYEETVPGQGIASLGLVEQDPSQGLQPAGRE
jgi:hypothetical protein